jgi:mRNA-degrading endonuclease RelE of RelBE toxin-antitoxin system
VNYQIEFTKSASKQLTKLPENVQQKIKLKVQELGDEPRPNGVSRWVQKFITMSLRVKRSISPSGTLRERKHFGNFTFRYIVRFI